VHAIVFHKRLQNMLTGVDRGNKKK